ncbi:MAG: hypothetical protein KBF88_00320 [Polyangiaceae bacterium]|nr:hypothetical protein [Polyangiaceae bacterium]
MSVPAKRTTQPPRQESRSGDPSFDLGARSIAYDVLLRVRRDQAFLSLVLDDTLEKNPQVRGDDRGLATEIVYGVTRTRAFLEARTAPFSNRPFSKLEERTKIVLAIGAYQILFLERVPTFAAIHSTVELAKRKIGPHIAGFINAILRKVAALREGPALDVFDATVESLPSWIREEAKSVGGDDAIFASHDALPITLCIPDASGAPEVSREEWLERFREARPEVQWQAEPYCPTAIRADGLDRVRDLPGYNTRAWYIQELGSQLLAELLPFGKGARVLDACAGRGQKARILDAKCTAVGAELVACDLYPQKLDPLRALLSPSVEFVGIDWTVGLGGLEPRGFDAILVDAPCSGIGTARRRPEILARITREKIEELHLLQVQVLTNVAKLLREGGVLLYATCSILRRECEDVVEAVLAKDSTLRSTPFVARPRDLFSPDATRGRLFPTTHGTDGYFVAQLSRVGD